MIKQTFEQYREPRNLLTQLQTDIEEYFVLARALHKTGYDIQQVKEALNMLLDIEEDYWKLRGAAEHVVEILTEE